MSNLELRLITLALDALEAPRPIPHLYDPADCAGPCAFCASCLTHTCQCEERADQLAARWCEVCGGSEHGGHR